MHAPSLPTTIGPVSLAVLPHAGGRGEPAARAWLARRLGVAPAQLALAREPHGRPCLGLPGRDCSWSHSGDRLLVALAEGVRVGVDVEVLRARPRALELARRYFHADEAALLATVPDADRDRAFLRLWCAKEAVLKSHGRGLAHGLARFSIEGFARPGAAMRLAQVDDGLAPAAAWTLTEVPLPGAVAVLAWRPDPAGSATAP